MRHVTEEDLVLYHYGEAENAAAVAAHLEACADCRTEYSVLGRILAAVDTAQVPERGEGYERDVWARLQPHLEPAACGWRSLSRVRQLSWAAGLAVLVLAAFVAGRFWPHDGPAEDGNGNHVRERILLLAVGEHLDRTEMVLAELVNARAEGPVDITQEQAWAMDLVQENRLYRQTAARTGEPAVATTLDELERVLLEIARGPSTLSAEEMDEFREQLESEGIVFKIRVLGSRVREREVLTASSAPTPKV